MTVSVEGGKVVIGHCHTSTPVKFEGAYKEHSIIIDYQKQNQNYYAWVTDPEGSYIVDGYFEGTMKDVIEMCKRNINL